MVINKNISVWRGDNTPPTNYHVWIKSDGHLFIYINNEWINIIDLIPDSSEEVRGLMTPEDKTKLDNFELTEVKGDAESTYRKGQVNITKENIGLGNVDNTSDIDKPISTAQQNELDKLNDSLDEHIQDKSNPHEVTKELVGLGNVTNDALVKRSEMGSANGVATLDNNTKISTDQIPDLDASKIISGTIDIERLPQGALERLVVVTNEAARKALTNVQNGDTVKQQDNGLMYYVKDDTKLSSDDGWEVYTAASATTVPWSGVTGKPSSYTPSTHTHSNISINTTAPLAGGGDLSTNRTISHAAGNAPNKASGFYKFSTDATSHISAVTTVTKTDITNLGIPAQDTTYSNATTTQAGLMSAADKTKLDSIGVSSIIVKKVTTEEFNLITSKDNNTLYIVG